MLVTSDTSQSAISTVPAAPQSTHGLEQHATPVGSPLVASRQLLIAAKRSALFANGGLLQTAVSMRSPFTQVRAPTRAYPVLHDGEHDDLSASDAVQSPRPPFARAAEASQDAPMHSVRVSTRSVHEVAPDAVKPGSHVGWHVEPLISVSVQSPTPPSCGGVAASHALSLRVNTLGSELWLPPWNLALHASAALNMAAMFVTLEVSHEPIS
mmetsp:Transcript_7271/g.32022  ORF Transcript_7271/g.32022 Transcript_7271/m.32022 type:complete len:211 (+) Transcript_7271:978-1610(+)